MREFGLRAMVRDFLRDRAGSSLYTVTILVILVFEFGSLAILYTEQFAPGANITTAADAMWWAIVTMSTVGYGDQSPVTHNGRLIGILVILVGVGLFGVITGFMANAFLGGDGEAEASPQSSDNTLALLQEIRKSQLSQEKTTEELRKRLADLERKLEIQ